MSSPSRLLKGRPTVPLPCQHGLNVGRILEGSPHSCPSLQPGSPASQKEHINNLLVKIAGLTLASGSMQEDVFQAVEVAVKELLTTDRASLFALDDHSQELYAQVFSVNQKDSTNVNKVLQYLDQKYSAGLSSYIGNLGKKPIDIVAYKGKQIRLPISKGIAGYVARTGNVMNVKDTNESEYFCDDFDRLTGYKTKTLLCVPLVANGKVMGVLEAVNKKEGHFSKMDEQILQCIALSCTLYLSHSHLRRECKRLENKCKVSNEMLQYHRQCTDEDFKELKAKVPQTITQYNIESFHCFTKPIPDDIKAHLVVTMISNLVDHSLFNSQQLLKFALTVSKNYRHQPYHNWDHAFHVAQCMYCILKGAPTHFSDVEKFALVLSGLCHDLDHRGFNNGFLVSTNHSLSQLYSSSVLENHHFSQTIELLQIEGLNVFSLLTDSDYHATIEIMQKAILATDLVNFFTNRSELSSIVKSGQFSWETPRHKELIKCLMMTACDLCGACKPWDIHSKSVEAIFEEFHAQGQVEKSMGLKPIEMMDIEFKHKIPDFQVGFIQNITEPCLQLLVTALPHMNVLLQTTQENKKKWQDIIEQTANTSPQ